MKIAIGADHGGFVLKNEIIQHLEASHIEIIDCGTYNCKSVDYPDYAVATAEKVTSGQADFGIVICGTGIGISISANKVNGIRCALCTDTYMARMARQHNDSNMLALGGRVLGGGLAGDIVDTFLSSGFETGGRHQTRVGKIMDIERNLSTEE
jgi:ribose 5-phosphate isomerase B